MKEKKIPVLAETNEKLAMFFFFLQIDLVTKVAGHPLHDILSMFTQLYFCHQITLMKY